MRHAIKFHRQSGFTLIELTIVLFIIGLLISPVVFFSPKFIDAYRADLTREKADRVMAAYSNFMQKHSRLPCVSWPQVSTDSPIIGAERNLMSPVNWQSGCQNNNAPGMSASITSHNVGVVPWRALGLPEDYIMDGWGRPFQVRADSKSSHPVDHRDTWALYNDDPSITYSEANGQVPSGCATADWWNMNYPDADRTQYDIDGKNNAGVVSAWRQNRRISHINMPKGRLCCGANWTRDFIERFDGEPTAFDYAGNPWGHDLRWQRQELSTTEFADNVGTSQHDHTGNLYDWGGVWMRNLAQTTIDYTYQSNDTNMRNLGWASWYQNNRISVGNWFYGGYATSYGPAQIDQPIYHTEPLAVVLISAGPNGDGRQVFDYDGSGNCIELQCDSAKVIENSSYELGNAISWSSAGMNGGITAIKHPFERTVATGQRVLFDDMVFYSKTDDLMAYSGRGTCSRP